MIEKNRKIIGSRKSVQIRIPDGPIYPNVSNNKKVIYIERADKSSSSSKYSVCNSVGRKLAAVGGEIIYYIIIFGAM